MRQSLTRFPRGSAQQKLLGSNGLSLPTTNARAHYLFKSRLLHKFKLRAPQHCSSPAALKVQSWAFVSSPPLSSHFSSSSSTSSSSPDASQEKSKTNKKSTQEKEEEGKKHEEDSDKAEESGEESDLEVEDGKKEGSWFNIFSWGRQHYEGGFEDKMDKTEAAKILGIRQNSCKEQIMDRYRNLMRSNHPDLGGSPFISAKINEAKELLYKRAKSDPEYTAKLKRREARKERKEQRIQKKLEEEAIAKERAASRAEVMRKRAERKAKEEAAKQDSS